jgi:hypothetical protein
VICKRLLDYIRSTTEQSIRNDVAKNLAQLANQYPLVNVTFVYDSENCILCTVLPCSRETVLSKVQVPTCMVVNWRVV